MDGRKKGSDFASFFLFLFSAYLSLASSITHAILSLPKLGGNSGVGLDSCHGNARKFLISLLLENFGKLFYFVFFVLCLMIVIPRTLWRRMASEHGGAAQQGMESPLNANRTLLPAIHWVD